MTVYEVKSVLETIERVMEVGIKEYPTDLVKKVIYFLKNMPESNIETIALLLKQEPDQIKIDANEFIKLLENLEEVFTQGPAEEIATFAKRLENRPAVLKLISWMI
jgi:wyosine [tRNA(Phe)-imidazoG37] synthetase (radical SAM superfamily)